MNRIYIPPEIIYSPLPVLEGDLHHQVSRVLRARAGRRDFRVPIEGDSKVPQKNNIGIQAKGDTLIAICGDGCEYIIKILEIHRDKTFIRIIEKKEKDIETRVKIAMYQGSLKGKGMEDIIPPLVYLGVSSLVPVNTSRSESIYKFDSHSKRKRLDGIIQRATALSGRTRLMELGDPISYSEALAKCGANSLNIIFWEKAQPEKLSQTLNDIQNNRMAPIETVGVFIGPEGGFSDEEIEQAKKAGLIVASLGTRTLDAKTAPVVAVAALFSLLGEI